MTEYFIAIGAGLISFLSPCVLPLIPLTFSLPAATRMRPILPSSKASTSIVALSVSISAITSPLRTSVPQGRLAQAQRLQQCHLLPKMARYKSKCSQACQRSDKQVILSLCHQQSFRTNSKGRKRHALLVPKKSL